jgi:ornithine cyclodeaminase/alanine dehydrogenase-like protein (mu-crystallin family)
VNGRAVARTFVSRGREAMLWDLDRERASRVAEELGASVAPGRDAALTADVVVTVTPGHEVLFPHGSLRPGQHVSLMGADGPGKAEIAAEELARVHTFCDDREQSDRSPSGKGLLVVDDWDQASHGGDTSHAVENNLVTRQDVVTLGEILIGHKPGRESPADITVFDSTGLAIQDLAIAVAAYRQYEAGELADVQTLTL